MEPMKPMKPMEPMKPLDTGAAWWPEALGKPSATGGQGGVRYAFFPAKRRLVIERDGTVTTYDSGEHSITGVQADGGKLAFTGKDGTPVDLDSLQQVP